MAPKVPPLNHSTARRQADYSLFLKHAGSALTFSWSVEQLLTFHGLDEAIRKGKVNATTAIAGGYTVFASDFNAGKSDFKFAVVDPASGRSSAPGAPIPLAILVPTDAMPTSAQFTKQKEKMLNRFLLRNAMRNEEFAEKRRAHREAVQNAVRLLEDEEDQPKKKKKRTRTQDAFENEPQAGPSNAVAVFDDVVPAEDEAMAFGADVVAEAMDAQEGESNAGGEVEGLDDSTLDMFLADLI